MNSRSIVNRFLKTLVILSAIVTLFLLLRKPSLTSSVIIWIDLPNVFPWRHCLSHSGGMITTSSCTPDTQSTSFQIVSSREAEMKRFTLMVRGSKGRFPTKEKRIW